MTSPSTSRTTATSSDRPASRFSRASLTSASSWTPEPVRVLFSRFPLQTLPANQLPARTLPPASRKRHTLFLFTTAHAEDGNAARIPSFNPSCLKWQTYLLMRGIDLGIQPSNNHASPSGSLPFLISSEIASSKESNKVDTSGAIVTTSALPAWAGQNFNDKQSQEDEALALREGVFLSLLEHRIRPAWLHAFYLTANLRSLAVPLYIHSVTSSWLLRTWQTNQLRAAAQAEVEKVSPKLDLEVLYSMAEAAFKALETALGDDDWFFGRSQPGLLDAAVFGYTKLLADSTLGEEAAGSWSTDQESQRLRTILRRFERLWEHQAKITTRFFTTKS